jgi:RimJ/RimL family protein N-acetyltransferase
MDHAGDLLAVAQDSDWSWLSIDGRTESATNRWIADALDAQRKGTEFPFTVFSKSTEKIIGSTRYMDVRPVHKGAEIGWTWYTSKVWATVVNPECKFLLLQHAFEDWGAIRVQLKTDNNNLHSQNAILKLGAKFEGRLRNHRLRRDGSYGDSMMYSITAKEWEETIKESLLARIASFSGSV